MIQKQAARRERGVRRREVRRKVIDADVFDHADARDLVERADRADLAIVAQLDAAAIRESRLRDPRRRQSAGRVPSVTPTAVTPKCIAAWMTKRAPSAPDVEEAVAGPEPQLPAHKIELRFLRIVEGVVVAVEIGARIHHFVPSQSV